nr:PREDICTED: uncharacterized protein DDB_G0290587-like [Linepithema humile]
MIADATILVNDTIKISTDITITTAASEIITEGSTTILPTTMITQTTTQPPFPPPTSTNPTSTTPTISSTTKMTSTSASETTNTNTTTNCTTKSTTSSESYMTTENITSAKTNKTHCRTTDPKFNYVVWNNKTENKTACILSNMTIQINIHYKIEDSQKNKITLTVPTNAITTGICSEKENEITLSWKESFKNQNDEDKKNKITFGYTYNATDNKSFLNFVSVDIYNFPYARERKIHEDTQHRDLKLFPIIKEGAFICKANTTINVGKQIDVVISDVRLITFNECDKDCSKTGVVLYAVTN